MFGLGFNRGGWHGMMDGWQAWPSWSHYTTDIIAEDDREWFIFE